MNGHAIAKATLRVLGFIGVVVGVIFLYAFLHEGGHALFVLLFGGTITKFEVNFLVHYPHISYVGITEPMQTALISLAGVIVPLTFVIPLTLFLPRLRNVWAQGISLLFLGSLLPSLVVSLVVSLAYGFGAVQSSEDVAKFLFFSGFNPFIVAGGFFILLVAILVFLLKVGKVKDTYVSVIRALRGPKGKRSPVLVGRVIVVAVLVVLGASMIEDMMKDETPVSQPLHYHTKVDVNLQDIEPGTTIYHTFQVENPLIFDFVYSLDTASGVTLRLSNLDGEPFVFSNQDYVVMYQGSGQLTQAYFAGFTLLEGNYALEVSPGGFGSLTMYIDSREPDAMDLQYLQLLAEIDQGSFTSDSYNEEGYELIYQGKLDVGFDQLLVTVPSATYAHRVSAFVVGEGDVSLFYVADGETHTLLDGFKATLGRGLPLHRSQGEFWVDVAEPSTMLYIYMD